MIAWFAFRSPAKIAASVSPIDAMKRQSETGFKKRKKNHKLLLHGWGGNIAVPIKRKWHIRFHLYC